MKRFKSLFSIFLNTLSFVLMLVGFLWMYFASDGNALSSGGFECLKYFTVLSNIFAGITSLIYLVCQVLNLIRETKIKPWALVLEYMSTISVAITFFVVVFFLAPVRQANGGSYFEMFRGANFFFHLIIPVICMINFIFFENETKVIYKYMGLDIIPVILYAVFYILNYELHLTGAVSQDGSLNYDWYGFLTSGSAFNIILMVLLFIAITIGLGFLFLFLKNFFNKNKQLKEK